MTSSYLDQDLKEAVDNGNAVRVRFLLKEGADPNCCYLMASAPVLSRAAANGGNADIVMALIAAGAKVDAVGPSGETALMRAKSPEIIRALIYAGAKVNARADDGKTALQGAAHDDEPDCMEALLEAGAENLPDDRGHTPLHTVAAFGRLDHARLLVGAGVELDAMTSATRLTPLMMAAQQSHHLGSRHGEVVELLLEHGANPLLEDRLGQTALDHALANGNDRAVRALRASIDQKAASTARPGR